MSTECEVPAVVEQTEGTSTEVDYEALFAQGKRNLLCKEIPQAVNQLQEACSIISKKFGETAEECAEVYYNYGIALLELSRMESGVLGNALQGITEEEGSSAEDTFVEPDATTEEEKAKISEEILDAMIEPEEKTTSEEKPVTEENKVEETTAEGQATEAKIEEAKEPGSDHSCRRRYVALLLAERKKKKKKKKKNNNKNKETSRSGLLPPVEYLRNETEKEVEKTEEKKEEVKEAEVKEESNGEKEEEKKEDEKTEEDEKKEEDDEEQNGEDDEGVEMEEGDEASAEESTEETTEKTEEDADVSNIQLAWEMLELAKTIYKRKETSTTDAEVSKECKLKQADCLMRLGEVGLETEQYTQAIGDFKSCLGLLTDVVEPDSRRLAEIHYQIGLACGYGAQYDEAVTHYRDAIAILELKITALQKIVDEAAEAEAVEAAKKELVDLKELIPDIQTKIEDAEEEKKSAPQLKEAIQNELGEGSSGFSGETSTGFAAAESSTSTSEPAQPVQNITHLVRKKRKPEEDQVAPEETKKVKTDDDQSVPEVTKVDAVAPTTNGTNGDHVEQNDVKSNGVEQGAGDAGSHEEKMDVAPIEDIPSKSVESVIQQSDVAETTN